MKKAQAAIFCGGGKPFEVREYEVQPPAPEAALLKLLASGICGTDIHIADGRLPAGAPSIIGHELIGKIEQLGSKVKQDGLGHALAVGDTVIACIALSCGKCPNCLRGETASCMNFNVTNAGDPDTPPHFHGGYAQYLHQPGHTLVKVPSELDPIAVAAFPCAGPTAIRAFAYGGGLEKDELVVVQGLGPVGLFAVAWAAAAGCKVVAIGSGKSPQRMTMARSLGATEVWDYRELSPEKRQELIADMAQKLGRGNGADVVFEASGAPTAVPEGMNLLRTRGRYLVPGQYSASGAVQIQPELITFKALRIIGSGQYTMDDIATYIKFLQQHPAVTAQLAACVTGKYPISAVNQALDDVRAGKGIKSVFVDG